MRYFLSVALLMIALMGEGQIVNIPDAHFKSALIAVGIDVNNDGQVQISEAELVTTLDVSSKDIADLTGIKSFTNLETLDCSNNLLISLDVSSMNRLRYVNSNYNNIRMDILTARNCDSLYTLLVSNVSAARFDISGSRKIQSLRDFSLVFNLFARGCTGLTEISSGTTLTEGVSDSLDVTGCTSLTSVRLLECNVRSLDFSTCINLVSFSELASSGELSYLNIKNGRQTRINLANGFMPPVLNICADDFEISNVRTMLSGYSSPYIISSYCTFLPGGTYNTISGKARLDANNNTCDITDRGIAGVAIKINDTSNNSLVTYTTQQGTYTHFTGKGNFTLTPYFPYRYFTVNPSLAAASFDTANNLTTNRDYCIQPNGLHNDLEISYLPVWPPARPGFDAGYTLVYKNRGTTTLSGNVQVNFDNNKMNFAYASTTVTSQSTGQLSWNYNNLQPFESRTIGVNFSLLPQPVNNINDTLTFLAAITPSTNDETQFDNSFILPQRVIGSYDPNDKVCLEGSKLHISKIGDYLHYQIRFQNEGTDTAFNVVVVDTLSNNLDWNSFEFIKASHGVDVRVTNNKVEFIFENIRLPYKAVNEPASNGWVAFKIKPKPSVVIGDSINNNAAIYFDFNFPIITNLVSTIVSNTGTSLPVKLEYFSISSRNNTNLLHWKATCTNGIAKFSIERSTDGIRFTSIGSITATALRCQLPLNFTDEQPAAGKNYYRLKITDADGLLHYSKTIVVGNSKAGLQVSAISGGIAHLNVAKQQTIRWQLIAADGSRINAGSQLLLSGPNQIAITKKALVAGIYTLVIQNADGEIITPRFKQ